MIDANFKWSLFIASHLISVDTSDICKEFPSCVNTVDAVLKILSCLDTCVICMGNPDDKFHELTTKRKGVFKTISGKIVLYMTDYCM